MSASPIRDADGKLAITPGVWLLGDENDSHAELELAQTDCQINTCRQKRYDICTGMSRNEMLANIHLCIEAGTVTNQTNRTPAELAALVRELRGALQEIVAQYDWQARTVSECEAMELANEAIAKSEGV